MNAVNCSSGCYSKKEMSKIKLTHDFFDKNKEAPFSSYLGWYQVTNPKSMEQFDRSVICDVQNFSCQRIVKLFFFNVQ